MISDTQPKEKVLDRLGNLETLNQPETPLDFPFVTIIMPVRNESAYIVGCMAAVFEQDYPPERMEIIVADGMSNDDTRRAIMKISRGGRIPVTILDNPQKIVPTGMNLAMRQARGDILIRVDGHCKIAPDYVRRCIEHIQRDGVDGVGGPMKSLGETLTAEVIAIGMSSPFGVGNSAFRTVAGKSMLVDSVPFPAYTRKIVERIGMYDEELVRNQDDEYNYRVRKLGGKILLAEDVHSIYFSRTSWGGLWRQYFQYGLWKVRVLQKLPAQMSLRQFVPPALVLALLGSLLIGLVGLVLPAFAPITSILALLAPGLYLFANLSAAGFTASSRGMRYLPLLPFVFAALHLGYGLGFLAGLLRFWNRWSDRVGMVAPFIPLEPGQMAPAWAVTMTGEVEAPLGSFERRLVSAAQELEPEVDRISRTSYSLKRVLDVLASLFGLVVLWPLFLMIGVLIRRDSPGPVFFSCTRIGRNGRTFKMLKFRTMKELIQGQEGPAITAQDDPRITPLGHWLRLTKLNELPQLWNVLKGEMSLVGPRPEAPEIAAKWPEEVRRVVLSISPGMTSPASVVYRNEEELLKGESFMDEYLTRIVPDKLRLDQLYVVNNTLVTDLDVIFWTLVGLLPRIKHATIPEGSLFWGPVSALFNRYFTWFMADTCVAFAAVGIAGGLWRLEEVIDLGLQLDIAIALVIALVFGIINYAMGLGRIAWRNAAPHYMFDLAFSSGLTTAILFIADFLWKPKHLLPLGLIPVSGLLAFLGFAILRYRARLITGLANRWVSTRKKTSSLGERVLIIGAGECGQLASWLLNKSELEPAFYVAGMVDDDPFKYKMVYDGHHVLGSTHDIPELVRNQNIGVIMYAISKIANKERERILNICQGLPVRVVVVPDLITMLQDKLLNSSLNA